MSTIKFIDDALFCATPFALSYTDPDQKWIIRQHLNSLFRDFASLEPSIGIFTHNDGSEVKLLNANGELTVSRQAPPVPLTIWVHEFYPQMAPIVYVNLENCMYPVYENHPFVDYSGAIISSYLSNWNLTKCNLSDLVHNLIKLFSHNHPFYYTGSSNFTHQSIVSKMEAMDRLVCMIYYDMAANSAKTQEEIQNLWGIQGELEKRKEDIRVLIGGLGEERRRLKRRTEELSEECDELLNWLRVYERGSVFAIDDAFEALDEESESVLERLAADLGLEDLIYALDKAVEEGALTFEVYMKHIRVLAREQFLCRAKMAKIERARDFL
ncbi:Vacuolar sorting protein/ubiquitin receptor VPS23 [Handroanthus impetiginosus]|uniref:Vacuolar sorting protein/ubiquitin receptor VPS23 n=1 Tax=Handroanthus impetiginosus TaxID=429701 RepID=A0A2G9H5P9_9LAMI|nr:Vacuolar sorting protein/ubiquitin receptor VPS23 [Handroanthus impetiginosus]